MKAIRNFYVYNVWKYNNGNPFNVWYGYTSTKEEVSDKYIKCEDKEDMLRQLAERNA